MVQLNLALREINCKIVYFGPGLSGKTTNLEVVHNRAPEDSRGELTSIATESDRTLFFDFMPLNLGSVGGMKTKFQLYTVPGQVYYNSTRKLVLRGTDGVVFVADSSPSKMEENIESLDNLEECLREQGRSLAEIAHVIQFNKRDLPDALTMEEMERQLNRYGVPCVPAVASKGDGVVDTFKALSSLVLEKVKAMAAERGGPRPGAAPAASSSAPAAGHAPSAPAPQPQRPPAEVRPSGPPAMDRRVAASASSEGRDRPAATAVAPPPRSSPQRTQITPQIATNPTPRPQQVTAPNPRRKGSSSHGMVMSSNKSVRKRSPFSNPLLWIILSAAAAGGIAFAYFKGLI